MKFLEKNQIKLAVIAETKNWKLKILDSFLLKKDVYKDTGLRSIIAYIIINERLSRNVRGVRVFRGIDLYTDTFFLVRKIDLFARWKKCARSTRDIVDERNVFNVSLLQDESILNRLITILAKFSTETNTEK